VEALLSRSDTPQSVGLLWKSDQPDARSLTENTQHSQDTDIYAPGGLQPVSPASEQQQTHALDRAATGITTGDARTLHRCT